jgi:hydrogenase maturation factor
MELVKWLTTRQFWNLSGIQKPLKNSAIQQKDTVGIWILDRSGFEMVISTKARATENWTILSLDKNSLDFRS